MDYYTILNLRKEPFSNSPEPEFLLQLPQYTDCLQKLELAVRLRRGINVVIGDIGTGKTTLCRKLIQSFSSTDSETARIETHLLLDPAFNSGSEFLQTFAAMLGVRNLGEGESDWQLKEKIKNYLFDRGVDGKTIVVLIIDEGQKIPENCLEILREFLNYETNEFKLLQIIIFAQKEFSALLGKHPNLLDRVNFLCYLKPLGFQEMREMIGYRLEVATDFQERPSFFTFSGLLAVYLVTRGYPRKIVLLCHQVILKMIVRQKKKAGWFLVSSCYGEKEKIFLKKSQGLAIGVLAILLVGIISVPVFQRYFTAVRGKGGPLTLTHTQSALPGTTPQTNQMPPSSPSVIREHIEEIKMPDDLGTISMPPKRTIWWTLYNIYGDTGSDIVRQVMKANAHVIKNIHRIGQGTVITLPAVGAVKKPEGKEGVLVALKSGKDLGGIYNLFRNHPDASILPPLAFFSFWNKLNGLEFAVVLDKCFPDDAAARAAIRQLPSGAAAEAKILSGWSADTVFFNRRIVHNCWGEDS